MPEARATGERGRFWSGLRIQGRVIGALLMREVLTRYGRHNIGFLWLFVENLLFTSAVVTLWALTHNTLIRGVNVIAFAVLGYSSVLVWRNCVNRVVKAIEPNRSLLYHRQVRIFDIYFARLILEVVASIGSFCFVYGLLLTVGLMEWPQDLGLFVGGWAMLIAIAMSLGVVIGPWSEISELLDRVWHIMTYILFPFSGAFILVAWVPTAAQEILLWVPLVHAVEMIRAGYFGPSLESHYDVGYVVVFCLGLWMTGLILMKNVARRVVLE